MHVIRIALEKLVYKDVEWESIPIFKEHIVAFQVRLVFHTVHDYTVPTQTFKEFFNHTSIIQESDFLVKKKPAKLSGHLVNIGVVRGTGIPNYSNA